MQAIQLIILTSNPSCNDAQLCIYLFVHPHQGTVVQGDNLAQCEYQYAGVTPTGNKNGISSINLRA